MLLGCLDPLSDDQAGYSRNLLASDATVPSVSGDPALARRVDMNDGISNGMAPLKKAFAVGREVQYWDLGTGKGTGTPAYRLARCDAEHKPLERGILSHPLLFDAVPGDADYTQFWSIFYVCVTDTYAGQLVTSLSALSDAYELGLLIEPTEPMAWIFSPVVQDGVVLEGAEGEQGNLVTAYARGLAFSMADFGALSFVNPEAVSKGKSIASGNVYEIARQGSTKVERVVFGSAAFNEDGSPSPKYSATWTLVNVSVSSDADITTFTQESDIAVMNMDKTFTKQSDAIVNIVASTTRTSRQIKF